MKLAQSRAAGRARRRAAMKALRRGDAAAALDMLGESSGLPAGELSPAEVAMGLGLLSIQAIARGETVTVDLATGTIEIGEGETGEE